MNEDPAFGMVAAQAERERALQPVARDLLRRWMRDTDVDGLRSVGRTAIHASTEATAQLAALFGGDSGGHVLDEVDRLATRLIAPPVESGRWWRRRKPLAPEPPSSEALAPLIAQLDRQRDEGARRTISITTAKARLRAAEQALEDAVHLVRALGPAIEAAVREIRGDDPARAAMLHERGAATLLERRQAILTQLAVHRQAVMTLDLLAANQQALNSALEQARTATLSALQVGMAARRATSEAAALDISAGAAEARRMLADALGRARTALQEMAPPTGDASPLDL